ncbi:MAG: di-trans,poly-cis-decaprenylcistransferase [Rikenellaceae bacterium]|nr:di-trans,poly-cis-decaprenylcistransferase [Rikenellaceae bacterium]MDE7134966.1 di-trans,poly-cis-decaprenylcistransferase [Rikenellaceae bacterium]MDE7355469.1 di-trans,poly-cis-decaprenylcistransferase [Rikenellaceae bacterium]
MGNDIRHVAVIMDGNGRWALSRGLERIEGHYRGVEAVRRVISASLDAGLQYLTIYAFSKENWGRDRKEVDGLMELFCKTIALEVPSLIEKNVKVRFLCDKSELSPDVISSLDYCTDKTAGCSGMTLLVALNYSGRAEIVSAMRRMAEASESDIDEKTVERYLYTAGVPDPDLIIRTSGEQRLSNFLLWQSAYSEFYFVDTLWPDFTEESFNRALEEFRKRKRRFGR